MNKKTLFVMSLVAAMLLSLPAFAYSDNFAKGKQCSKKECSGGHDQCPIMTKLLKKAHFLLEHKTDLGLTDDQVKAIKDLKIQAKKDDIQQSAAMRTFMLDLYSKLSEDKVDVEGANAFIDKTFSSMIGSAKSNVQAYAKLKGLLTPEQVGKMKALHEKEKHAHGSAT